MDRAWMYNASMMDAYFHGELDKFIKVAENHARMENTVLIHCPCKVCGNLKVFRDPTTIRSHMIVSGFVKYYTIWKKHGEMDVPPLTNNLLDEIIQGDDFDIFFMLIMILVEMTMVSALMMERVDSIVMMSMTGPLIVTVLKMNLMMEIF